MVTGKRLFEGATVSDILAAVLTKEPGSTRSPRNSAPCSPAASSAIRASASAGSAKPTRSSEREEDAERQHRTEARWILPVVAAGALILGAALAWLLRLPPPAPEPALRAFSLAPASLSASVENRRAAIAPNGKRVAYVAEGKVWIRDLASQQARPIAGSEDARDYSGRPTAPTSPSPPESS